MEKNSNPLSSLFVSYKKTFGVLFLLILAIAIPVTLGVIKQEQDNRQEAATTYRPGTAEEIATCKQNCPASGYARQGCLTSCEGMQVPVESGSTGITCYGSTGGGDDGCVCSRDDQCRDGSVCVGGNGSTSFGICDKSSSTTTKKDNGQRCTSGDECKSRQCSTATYCGVTAKFCVASSYNSSTFTCPTATRTPTKTPTRTPTKTQTGTGGDNVGIGGSCSRDSQCASGNCNINNVCVQCKTDGDCAWNEHCTYMNEAPNWTCKADNIGGNPTATRTPTRTPSPTGDGGNSGTIKYGCVNNACMLVSSTSNAPSCNIIFGACGTTTTTTTPPDTNTCTTRHKISGTVKADTNGDGTVDLNISGATVRLTKPVSKTTTTNAQGYYEFTGLSANAGGQQVTSTIEVVVPDGYRAVSANPRDNQLGPDTLNGACFTDNDVVNFELATGTTTTTTPTSTPTPTSSITPTQPTGDMILQVSATLPGIGESNGNNNAPMRPTRSGEVQIVNSSDEVIKTVPANFTYTDGVYKSAVGVSGVAPGTYLVKVKMDNTLFTQLPGIVTLNNGNNTLASVQLIPGDLNQENELNMQDHSIFVACYGESNCQEKTQADFDDDGDVDGQDYNILIRSFAIRAGD